MKHRARKRFGQNFLSDPGMIDRIIRFIAPQQADEMIEIGPGQGAITQHLLPAVKQLTVIEIDRDLAEYLQSMYVDESHFTLVNQDVLKVDFKSFAKKIRVVGNLPYNISTPLLFHLFQYADQITDLNIMLQKEVVDRMGAQPSTSDYGRLSVMTQYHCKVGRSFLVPQSVFTPKPKVDSAFVRLEPYSEKPFVAENYELFSCMVRDVFNMRRKQLKNSLSKYLTPEQLLDLGIEPSKRPEDVTLQEYVAIANGIGKYV